MAEELHRSGSSSASIDSSNRGFQLLKKHGWKEGTGLGANEQGRLEPVETHSKQNKRGLGADKRKKISNDSDTSVKVKHDKDSSSSKKSKALSKKLRKMQEIEKHLKEKEFEQAFFREFWPENV